MKKHIVCFGDSNTHGYCAANNGRYDEDHRWTCLLQKSLGEEYLILEEGLSGRTTSFDDPVFEGLSGVDYIYPCLMSHEPVDLLIIMLGTNDTKERFNAGAPSIGLGLARLLRKAISVTDAWKGQTPRILVVTPQNIGKAYETSEVGGTMGKGCAEKSQGLGREFEKIAAQYGCEYLDVNQAVESGPNEIDYMHLTAEGHAQLAQALDRKVREIFN